MQNATVTTMNQREQGARSRARAIVRFNALIFHGLAVASFLETAAPLHASRLAHVFAGHPDLRPWLDQVWGAQRTTHGRLLRDYIEATWPEFDWDAAYDEFHESYRRRARAGRREIVALEALGCCAREAQAAVFYRALARCADEPVLRALVHQAGRDHEEYFDRFRSIYERHERIERAGLTATCRTVLESSRAARDVDVALAFQPLARHWRGSRLIADLEYVEFLPRMVQVVDRHAALGRVERLLFRPWIQPRRVAVAPAARWPVPQLAAASA
jgi:hypothetical protein